MGEKTKLMEAKEWFENKRIFVFLAIFLITYIGIANFLKSTKDIKESVQELTNPISKEEKIVQDDPQKESISLPSSNIEIHLTGKITDDKNYPIQNATVELVGVVEGTNLTDDSGNFILKKEMVNNQDELELMVSKKDFKTVIQKIDFSINKKINLGRIILNASTQEKKNTKSIQNINTGPSTSTNNSKITFEKNTINGNVINNPSGPIEINNTLAKDTARNE